MSEHAPTQNTRLFSKDMVLIIVVNFFTFMSFQLFPSALPLYARSLGVADGMLGWIMAITTISALAVRPIAGMVVDRHGRHGVMIAGFIVMAAAVLLMAVVPLFGALLAFRFIQGIGWGCCTTSNSTTASDIIPKSRFAEGMGYYSLSTAIALAVAPGLGIELLNMLGMTVLSGISTAFLALAAITSFFIAYKRIDPESAPRKAALIEAASAFPAITVFFISFCYGAIVTFLAIDAESRGVEGIALFFTVYALATLVSRPVSGRLTDKRGFTLTVVMGIVLMVPSLLLIALSGSLGMYLTAAVLLGIGYGTLQSSLSAMAVVLAHPSRRGAANATYLLGFDGGIGVGAIASGWLAGALGYQGMFLVVTFMPCIALAIYGTGLKLGFGKGGRQGAGRGTEQSAGQDTGRGARQ